MNIEHEGQTYEVLTLDRISEITHAKLAGGKVVTASEIDCGIVTLASPTSYISTRFGEDELEHFGIQPLRLVPKEPVTFEATFAKCHGARWRPVYDLDEGIALQGCEQRKFRCVEIGEEEAQAILKAKGVV
jgi:hypothetical protein